MYIRQGLGFLIFYAGYILHKHQKIGNFFPVTDRLISKQMLS